MSINAYQEELVEKKKFLKYVRQKIPDIKLTDHDIYNYTLVEMQ